MFDRGIKDKLLKELGEKMTPEQSALLSDLATIASAGYANRNRMPGYTAPTTPRPARRPSKHWLTTSAYFFTLLSSRWAQGAG